MSDPRASSASSLPHDDQSVISGGRRSILIHDGKRPRRSETNQSIHFAERQETFTIPEPPEEELPEFFTEEERLRALGSAKELAEAALSDDKVERVEQEPASCFNCCAAAPEASASDAEADVDLELSEEVIEKLSSKKLNSIIHARVSRELSRGPSLAREGSFHVGTGIVSFSSFITSKQHKQRSKEFSCPFPLVDYLPPSPLFTFDGKCGVNCMAFKLDFTDRMQNIVPPFFLADGEKLDEKAQEILKQGMSYATHIDMFGPKDIEFITKEEEPSAAHKDLLNC